jgi:hypothetical protein
VLASVNVYPQCMSWRAHRRMTPRRGLQVLGNFKGVAASTVSVLLFKNKVSITGCVGYAVTMAGVMLYGEMKRRTVHNTEEHLHASPLLKQHQNGSDAFQENQNGSAMLTLLHNGSTAQDHYNSLAGLVWHQKGSR